MFAALMELPAAPSTPWLSVARRAGARFTSARRRQLCPGVEVVLDLWKAEPTAFAIPFPTWQRPGPAGPRCADMGQELFFRTSTDGPDTRRRSTLEAEGVCTACPVRRQCLTHALSKPEHFGVWGGVSARRRKMMLKNSVHTIEELVDQCLE